MVLFAKASNSVTFSNSLKIYLDMAKDPQSLNHERIEKLPTLCRQYFRKKTKKKVEFVVNEVTVSSSGIEKSSIRAIVTNLKPAIKKLIPVIRISGFSFLTILILRWNKEKIKFAINLIQHISHKFLLRFPLQNNVRVNNKTVACILNSIPRKIPVNPLITNNLLRPIPMGLPVYQNYRNNQFWSNFHARSTINNGVARAKFYNHRMNVMTPRGGQQAVPQLMAAVTLALKLHNQVVPLAGSPLVNSGWSEDLFPVLGHIVGYYCNNPLIGFGLQAVGGLMNQGVDGFQVNFPPGQGNVPQGAIRKNTDILLTVTKNQIGKKSKHMTGITAGPNQTVPEACGRGKRPVQVAAELIFNATLGGNTTFHGAEFNNHYGMMQPAIVALAQLAQNESDALGIVYILEQGFEFLDKNFTLPPHVKARIKLVRATYRTAYYMQPKQIKRLIDEGKVQ